MFTGTLIDELMSTVERAEENTSGSQEVNTAYWYTATEHEGTVDLKFLGVA